jgi:hypothetical protein
MLSTVLLLAATLLTAPPGCPCAAADGRCACADGGNACLCSTVAQVTPAEAKAAAALALSEALQNRTVPEKIAPPQGGIPQDTAPARPEEPRQRREPPTPPAGYNYVLCWHCAGTGYMLLPIDGYVPIEAGRTPAYPTTVVVTSVDRSRVPPTPPAGYNYVSCNRCDGKGWILDRAHPCSHCYGTGLMLVPIEIGATSACAGGVCPTTARTTTYVQYQYSTTSGEAEAGARPHRVRAFFRRIFHRRGGAGGAGGCGAGGCGG